MAKKNVRNMKVCGQSGYKYETVPAITLKGKWLEELGFQITLTCLEKPNFITRKPACLNGINRYNRFGNCSTAEIMRQILPDEK